MRHTNESLNDKTEGARTDFGGNFATIIKRYEQKKIFRVDKVNKKETWIYPNISLIEKEVKRKQIENSRSPNKRLIRIINKKDIVFRPREIFEPSVPNSESLTRQKSKARDLSDSEQISERLSIVVTRANPKEVSK